MNARDKAGQAVAGGEPPPERASRIRQRQRLIDACISALHIHGPSRTTVEKVVALADLSPGIVRFYFESKAAMLVASLEFLAAEFEQRVLEPVAALKHAPVRALELLVELYFDPDIASPRKVSVWYSFWGEASSREEYLEICGNKDDAFATLVHELIERLIEESGERHLDADAVALGLIGVLEVLWQGIAFQTEAHIDRGAARRRSMAYLRSVFPREFARADAALARITAARLPSWAYADAALFSAEREQLFRPAWQFAGHEAEMAGAGAYLTIDLSTERALLVRDEQGAIQGFHNTCRHRPHALLAARHGVLQGCIECTVHGLRYGYDGSLRVGETPGALSALEVATVEGLIFVRQPAASPSQHEPLPLDAADEGPALRELAPEGVIELTVQADWKLVVEQWLESAMAARPVGMLAELVRPATVHLQASGNIQWQASLAPDAQGWTAGHYARQAARQGLQVYPGQGGGWQRRFLPPNQLLEIRPDGVVILQVIPEAPGRCLIRRFDLRRAHATRSERALHFLARRLLRRWLSQDAQLAESIQSGLEAAGPQVAEAGAVPEALASFRRGVLALLPALPAP